MWEKIYCVSDFYLPTDELRKIMYAADIPKDLFDGILYHVMLVSVRPQGIFIRMFWNS